jgi:hypothetical protein
MRVEVGENGQIELKEVYDGITLISDSGEKLHIGMRDSGFEFNYGNKLYSAKEGKVEPLTVEDLKAKIEEAGKEIFYKAEDNGDRIVMYDDHFEFYRGDGRMGWSDSYDSEIAQIVLSNPTVGMKVLYYDGTIFKIEDLLGDKILLSYQNEDFDNIIYPEGFGDGSLEDFWSDFELYIPEHETRD